MVVDRQGNERIKCEKCGRQLHALAVHLGSKHAMSVEEYQKQFPGAPTISAYGRMKIQAAQRGRAAVTRATPPANVGADPNNNTSGDPNAAAIIIIPSAPTPISVDPNSAGAVALPVDPSIIAQPDIKDWAGKEMSFGVATLPIRGMATLSPEMIKFIPAHDDNYRIDDYIVERLALGIQHCDNVLMVGPTGAGKTTLAEELAALVNQPVRRANLHGDIRASDFVGEKVIETDPVTSQAVVSWRDGILPHAMRNGYWLVLDELDAAPPQILFVLQAVLDSSRKLVLTANHGEVVTPHPDFRIIATANTIGHGDDTGLYAGTHILNEAFLDRFGVVIKFKYLEESNETDVVARKGGIQTAVAAKMVQAATMIRRGFDSEECYCTLSTRRLIGWAKKAAVLGVVQAAEITILNKLNKDDHAFVQGVIQRLFGG